MLGELSNVISSIQFFLDTPVYWTAWMNSTIDELKQAYLDPLNEKHASLYSLSPLSTMCLL